MQMVCRSLRQLHHRTVAVAVSATVTIMHLSMRHDHCDETVGDAVVA